MKSSDKIDVRIKVIEKYGKPWVFVSPKYKAIPCPKCRHRFIPTEWELVPSFEDNMRMLYAYGYCEDKKYPNGKGRHMITELVVALMESEPEPGKWDEIWVELCQRFNIPIRDDRAGD